MHKMIQQFLRAHKKIIHFWLDLLLNLVIVLGTVYFIRTFVMSLFIVSGPSMCDTLNYVDDKCQRGNAETIIVNKALYQNLLGWQMGKPERGDIIVFHPPHNPDEFFIKRIIGLPDETVKLKNGSVHIFNKENPNGYKLDESYLNSSNKNNTYPFRDSDTTFIIPNGSYFVLGDNRIASSDSRSCFKESVLSAGCGQGENTPFLKRKNIEGKAWIALWPLNKIRLIPDTAYSFAIK